MTNETAHAAGGARSRIAGRGVLHHGGLSYKVIFGMSDDELKEWRDTHSNLHRQELSGAIQREIRDLGIIITHLECLQGVLDDEPPLTEAHAADPSTISTMPTSEQSNIIDKMTVAEARRLYRGTRLALNDADAKQTKLRALLARLKNAITITSSN